MPLSDLDVQYFKENFLTGFTFYGADCQPLPDSFYAEHLQRALATLEAICGIDILSRVYVGEKHDYKINDYVAYAFVQLFKIPTRTVESVRAVYPTGQTIQVFPSEWVKLEIVHSQIQLVPTAGTISQIVIGQGGDFLPLVYSGLPWLPQLWEVDYTSGFDPDKVPKIIIQAIAKIAAIEIMMVVGDMIRPLGVTSQSLSVDGLSQSRGFLSPAFQGRIDGYRTDLYGPSGT